MLKRILLGLFLVFALPAFAQSNQKDQVLELKGGDKVVVRADGTMAHYDANGLVKPMPEGVVMTTADGTRVMMKEQSLWHEILGIVGSTYGRATAEPYLPKGGAREIQLRDGGRLAVGENGKMSHYDGNGRAVTMKDGDVMVAKDGSRILMVNGGAWKQDGIAGEAKPKR